MNVGKKVQAVDENGHWADGRVVAVGYETVKESAMFVCIVMDYYKNGDLDRLLRPKRAKKEAIEEVVVKKWIGQMIEALVFVHKNEVIHRDLKPSNIFIQEDLGISLGDFGVATIMGDARTKTRTTVGSMNWMAPEVLERPYDERSDVWSAGCIILEMVTCGFYDHSQMTSKLCDIKHNPQALEEALEEVGKTYSADLVAVIRTMLRRNFKQRPTAVGITELPFIKDCLSLSGSALADKKTKASVTAGSVPVPKGKGIDPILVYLKDNINNENCVRDGFKYLTEITKDEGISVDKDGKLLIVKAMRLHVKCEEVVLAGCQILNNLIVTANGESDVLFTSDIIAVVPLVMKSNSSSAEVQLVAASVLNALSADEGAADVIGTVGGIQDVLAAMRAFPNNAKLIATCCAALWSLTVTESNAKILTEEKGIQDVCSAMQAFPNDGDLIKAAAAALLSLSMEDDNLEHINDLDCAGLLISAIQTHMKEAEVVKNACMTLASLVEPDEESAFKVLNNERQDGSKVAGLPIIIQAYKQHKDNADVVENICTLFMELVEYDDLCSEMNSLKIPAILKEIKKKYIKNEDIMAPCEAALTKLGGGKVSQRPTSARSGRKN